MDDKQIVELYFARAESAITETERKYSRYCYSIAYHILDSREDAEEVVNDTYLKTWNSIPPQRPNCLKAFLTKITRTIAIDRYRRNGKIRRHNAEDRYVSGMKQHLNEIGNHHGEGIGKKGSENRALSKINSFFHKKPFFSP